MSQHTKPKEFVTHMIDGRPGITVNVKEVSGMSFKDFQAQANEVREHVEKTTKGDSVPAQHALYSQWPEAQANEHLKAAYDLAVAESKVGQEAAKPTVKPAPSTSANGTTSTGSTSTGNSSSPSQGAGTTGEAKS